VRNLTVEEVRKIYTREITNWNQVGGENAVIHVITREEGSGTRGTFEDIVMDDEEIWVGALIQPSTGAVRAAVAGDRRAIGYISFAALDGTVRAPSIGGVPATIEDMRAGRYPIVRRFLLLTAEAPTGAVREFIDFILSEEGQRIVEDEDGIPVK
jgi:phosphate transport system substrate-binding protein